MEKLTINDCGTAHEDKLLEIYNDVVSLEKLKTGKEPTSLEKSKIEMQVAEAYQTILNSCKDGGSISQALNLLGKRITSSQISVNEISKVAVEVTNEVHTASVQNEGYNVENDSGNLALETVAAAELVSGGAENSNVIAPIDLPDAWGNIDTPEMAEKYDETSKLAENGDKNAQYIKGLMNYALDYLRTVDNEIPKGKEAMVLTLIQNLAKTGNSAALEMSVRLSEKYKFDVFSIDENGNNVLDEDGLFDMYRERMLQINPNAADSIVDFSETKRDFLIEKGKNSPKTYEENKSALEDKKRRTVFTRVYNRLINAGEIEKAEEYVRQNLDIAKAVLDENVVKFGEAQAKGNKKFMAHLQKVNSPLSKAVAQASRDVKAIDSAKVDVAEVVSSVNPNPKSLIPDDREL